MGFMDYLKDTINRKITLIEVKQIVKLICRGSTYFVNQPLLNTLVCDLNALSFFAEVYYVQCKEANELDNFESFMTNYQELGYPCCNSLLYSIYTRNDQLDNAVLSLQKA